MKDMNFLISNGVNVQASMDLFGDIETYNDTLIAFLETIDQKMKDIDRYKTITDMPNYAILVHSLKSDAKYLGFTNLAEMAYKHEMESKANNIIYVIDCYNELINEVNRIIYVVKTYLGQTTKEFKPTEPTPKNETIIVVDDSDIIRKFIRKIFDNQYDVMVANDGKEAIDMIELNPNKKFVCMLLDLNMPYFNGFEVLDYFKRHNLFEKIPVSIITGDDTKETLHKAFDYPIAQVLTKPFNERDIKIVLEKTLHFNG